MNKLGTEFRQSDTKPSFIVAALSGLVTTVLYFPGFMSFDSLQQLRQAIGSVPLNDAHPVVIVYVWRLCILVFGNEGSLFVVYQIAYWVTIWLLAKALFSVVWRQVVFVLLFGCFPPMFLISLHVWKDVPAFIACIFWVAATIDYIKGRKWRWWLAAAAALVLCTLFRQNMIAAVVPLALAQVAVTIRGRRMLYLAPAYVAVLLVSTNMVQGYLQKGVQHIWPWGTILVWDIASVAVDQNVDVLPTYLARATTGDFMSDLKKKYSEAANYPIYDTVSAYPPEDMEGKLWQDWWKVISAYPVSYLKHRAALTGILIGLTPTVYYPFHPGVDPNEFNIEPLHKSIVASSLRIFAILAELPFYRVWFLLLCGIAASAFMLRAKAGQSARALIFGIQGSAGLLLMSLAAFAPAADFRYVVWVACAQVLAVALTISIATDSAFRKALGGVAA